MYIYDTLFMIFINLTLKRCLYKTAFVYTRSRIWNWTKVVHWIFIISESLRQTPRNPSWYILPKEPIKVITQTQYISLKYTKFNTLHKIFSNITFRYFPNHIFQIVSQNSQQSVKNKRICVIGYKMFEMCIT